MDLNGACEAVEVESHYVCIKSTRSSYNCSSSIASSVFQSLGFIWPFSHWFRPIRLYRFISSTSHMLYMNVAVLEPSVQELIL